MLKLLFSDTVKEEIKEKIINLTSLILTDETVITTFNEISNPMGDAIHSKEDTKVYIDTILRDLSFHVLPFAYGYGVYAHTDFKKNIYLSSNYLPRKEDGYSRLLMSVISLIHEIGHLKKIESLNFCSPLEFTLSSLKYEDGDSFEEKIFGSVVDFDPFHRIDTKQMLKIFNVKNNFLKTLKESFKMALISRAKYGYQNMFPELPKD